MRLTAVRCLVARAVPSAVREAEEDAANARDDMAMRPLVAQIEACKTCYDLGKAPVFSYDSAAHMVTCGVTHRGREL